MQVPIYTHFKVQVRTCGVAGGTDKADDLASLHRIANLDQPFGLVGIGGGHAIAVVNEGIVAVGNAVIAFDHLACQSGTNRSSRRGAHIQAGMQLPPMV